MSFFFPSGRAVHHDIIVQLGGGFKYFLFSPVLGGKWSNLTNIFQMGWNQQPVIYQTCQFFFVWWFPSLSLTFTHHKWQENENIWTWISQAQNAMLVYPNVADFFGIFPTCWLNIFCPTVGIVALMNGTFGMMHFSAKFASIRSHSIVLIPQIQ